MGVPHIVIPGKTDPYSLKLRASGLIAESCDRTLSPGSFAFTSQSFQGAAIPLMAGQVVTNLHVCVTIAGTNVTVGRLGLYSKAGAVLASCANDTTIWTATAGMRTVQMTAAYTVPADDIYYGCGLAVFTGTAPSIVKGVALSNALAAVGSGSPLGVNQAGQADLPSPATFVASGSEIWVGAS